MTDSEQEKKGFSRSSNNANSVFGMGEIVCLRSDSQMSGVVTGITPGGPETRYSVFMDNKISTFYHSQLSSLIAIHEEPDYASLNEFNAKLTAIQLVNPSLNTLYSLSAAKVNFIPYQFLPALKLIRADRPRLLIADGVGVGKTIEAGLILRELQARREINKVLVLCPKALVVERKWELEMKRFDERFIHLDGPTLRYCLNETDLDGVWPEQYSRSIVPYSLFDEAMLYGQNNKKKHKRQKPLMELDPPPIFDLVIVDESHHVRNTETYAHRAVRFFTENSEAVIFLTATPIQLGDTDLFNQLSLIRPDVFINKAQFQLMSEPNPFINAAASASRSNNQGWQDKVIHSLKKSLDTQWGKNVLKDSPDFKSVMVKLESSPLTETERVHLTSEIESLHTLSGFINRTRRSDIGNFTVRKPETVNIEFTPKQRLIHDKLLQIQANILSQKYGDRSVKFMMTTLRRQAASCLFGLMNMIQELSGNVTTSFIESDPDAPYDSFETNSLADVCKQFEELADQINNLEWIDPKLEALKSIISKKQLLENRRLMVFSSFRHTLAYLSRNLISQGFRTGQIHGGVPDHERMSLREQFKMDHSEDGAIDVLLFSEVGAEGLDYQFCDCIVNYDLPWNPMRVEQRIGRIDRWGQRSESVAIYNLITPGTVDADIYERCLLRIGVFNNALGASEEILGQMTREIRDVAENITLNEKERQSKLQQITDNKIRMIKAENDLESQQSELFGIGTIQKTAKQIQNNENPWIAPTMLENMVRYYLEQITGSQKSIVGEKPLKNLRLAHDFRTRLLHDFSDLSLSQSNYSKDWEHWLKGGQSTLSITFDPACASENEKAILITPVHPLARQAAYNLSKNTGMITTAFEIVDSNIPPGNYPFSIYHWHYIGLGVNSMLKPVCESLQIMERFFELLNNSLEVESPEALIPSADTFDHLDTRHHEMWVQARSEHMNKTRELAEHKTRSLTESHAARISLLTEQLNSAADERIIKMRQSQIAKAEADFLRRLKEIEETSKRWEILSDRVAQGVLIITGG